LFVSVRTTLNSNLLGSPPRITTYRSVRTAYASPNTTYDNSGWNGCNNNGYNNTWYDGREYHSDPIPLGEDIAADPTDRAPVRSHVDHYR
jgi:hypothetical protein